MGHTHSSALVAADNQEGSAIPFSRDEQRMLKEYLQDFYFPYHSTKTDHQVMIAHWDQLFAQTKQPASSPPAGGPISSPMVVLFDNFYKYLFEMVPQVKPLFRSSMQVQGKALVRIISSIKNMLQSPDLLTMASDLAQRHVKYGIELPYFNVLGITLMKTLKSCSEELWTPETELAWKHVYGHVALIVASELAKKTRAVSTSRRSSLLAALSYRRQSGAELPTGAGSSHHIDQKDKKGGDPYQQHQDDPKDGGVKSGDGHHHHHHGAGTLNPNARCPMSGNRLKDMIPANPEHQEHQDHVKHQDYHRHIRNSATGEEADQTHNHHDLGAYSLSGFCSWLFGSHHHTNSASKYAVGTE